MLQVTFALLGPMALLALAVLSIDRHFRRFEGYRPASALGLVADEARFETHGPAIGRWGDFPIYEYVVQTGRRFVYDRLARPDYRYSVATNELFVAPGMVYVAR